MSKLQKLIEELCPEGVEYKKLGEVCSFITGFAFKATSFKEQGSPICKTTNIQNNKVVFEGMVCVDLNDYKVDLDRYIIRPSDIVIGMSGSIKVGINETNSCCYLNQRVGKFSPRKDIANRFLYYYLCQSANLLTERVSGGSVKNLSNNDILSLEIPVPPLPVQEEIVRILDKFTTLEAELEAELDCRKQQYEFYRNQLLSFEGERSEGVKWMKLSLLSEVGTGSSNKQDASADGKYPFFVRSKIVERHDNYEYDEEAIIIPGEGGIGDIFHYVNGKYALHQRVYRIHFITDEVLTKFAYYYLHNSFKKYILGKAVSATVTSIRKPMIENFSIPVPLLSEQHRIVSILDRFEVLTSDLQSGLPAEIEARRKQYEYYREKLLTFKRKTA